MQATEQQGGTGRGDVSSEAFQYFRQAPERSVQIAEQTDPGEVSEQGRSLGDTVHVVAGKKGGTSLERYTRSKGSQTLELKPGAGVSWRQGRGERKPTSPVPY